MTDSPVRIRRFAVPPGPTTDPTLQDVIAHRLRRFPNLTDVQIAGLVQTLDPNVVEAVSDGVLAQMVAGTLPTQPLQPGGGMPLGLPGAQTLSRFAGGTDTGAPTSGTFHQGDFVVAADGHIFVCTVAGVPGTWLDVALADIVASTPDATASVKGLLKLAGDLGGTAAAPTVPGLAGKQPVAVPTAVKTGAYTAAANDLIPVDTTSGPVTVTLPAAPADKTRVTVKHVVQGGSNAVTIARGGSSDVFNKAGGSTSLTLTTLNQAMTVQYAASSGIWYVVNDSLTPAAVVALGSGTYVPGKVQSSAPSAPAVGDVWADSSALVGSGCRAYKSIAQNITSSTHTAVTLDLENYDDAGFHDLVTNNSRIVIPATGRYEIGGQNEYAFNATGDRGAIIWKNGVGTGTRLAEVLLPASTVAQSRVPVSTGPVDLVSGDFIELGAYQSSGTSPLVLSVNDGAASVFLWIKRVR